MVALDSLVIAVIAYIITMSMALIFAHKMNYEVDANQELLAQVRYVTVTTPVIILLYMQQYTLMFKINNPVFLTISQRRTCMYYI